MMKFKQITLLANELPKVKAFYSDTFGLPIIEQTNQKISFQVGESTLTFKLTTEYHHPIYHYAFNIPENQFDAARQWLLKRIKPIVFGGKDTFDFVNWNAHSIYYFDSVGNIGELIARHDLPNAAQTPFSALSITRISEIGLPVSDVTKLKAALQCRLPISTYVAGSDKFDPLGSPVGLLICVPLQRNWYPTNVKSDLFPIEIILENATHQTLVFETYHITY